MANMSYCRFENTQLDLEDCCDHMGDKDLSKRETEARSEIIELARKIVDEHGDE